MARKGTRWLAVAALSIASGAACSLFSDTTALTDGTSSNGGGDGSDASGDSVSSSNDGAPTDGASANDGGATTDGGALDAGPTSSTCVIPSTVGEQCPPAGSGGACEEGGVTWNGRCYFANRDLSTALQAAAFCNAHNATMATFTCANEWNAVYGALGINGLNYVLGATRVANDCSWHSNEPWTYAAWAPNEPTFDGGFNCIAATSDGWHLWPCTASSGAAICERP